MKTLTYCFLKIKEDAESYKSTVELEEKVQLEAPKLKKLTVAVIL
jgi:hypothetical protein